AITLDAEESLQGGLTVDQRRIPKIEAIKIKKIECVIDEAVRAAGAEIILQQRIVGEPARALNDHFAIEDFYLSLGDNVRTISYMPGSNFAIVSASSRKGSGPESRRMDS